MGKVPSLTLRVKADRILLSIDHILDAIASTDSSDSVGSGSPTTIWSMPNMLILIKQTNPLNSPEISLGWRQCNSHWEGEVCRSRRLRSLSLGFRLTDSRVLDVIEKGEISSGAFMIFMCVVHNGGHFFRHGLPRILLSLVSFCFFYGHLMSSQDDFRCQGETRR